LPAHDGATVGVAADGSLTLMPVLSQGLTQPRRGGAVGRVGDQVL
jgi:hypothetical protein